MSIHPDAFVRDAWYVAEWSHEIGNDKPRTCTILGEPIVLFRTQDGKPVALADRCVHRHAPLSMGRIEGNHLRCMYHGLRFDAEGRCVEIPSQERIPVRACVRSYPIIERGGWAWLWMGDANAADPALIPPVCGFDDPSWVLKFGQLDYDAPYSLINDNLLDLSHLAYVHANSFGATTGWSRRPPRNIVLERGVRVERWVEGAPPVPPLPSLAHHASVDLWVTYDFLVPGVFIMYTAMYPAGTAQTAAHGAPSPEWKPLFCNLTAQAVTPLTADSSRTFFTWGPGSAYGGEEIAQQMIDVATLAFREDKTIIEAQARVIASAPDLPMMPTAGDKAVALFQRVMDRLRPHIALTTNDQPTDTEPCVIAQAK